MALQRINIANRVATHLKKGGPIVCGNTDYAVEFIFDSEWDGYEEKTARFVWNDKYQDTKFTGTLCPMPAVHNTDVVSVGVFAGDLCTTTPALIPCQRSILCASYTPHDENEVYYASEAQKAADLAADAADRAEAAAEDADSKAMAVLAEAKASGEFDGKSAYAYAQESGYTGTEAQYAEDVNPDNLREAVGAPPAYWMTELEQKADAIQAAMEQAGRHKSAFLWYTDAHWVNGNSKVSPSLLRYLYENTPMAKVNFGGDIIGNSLLATREDMKYLYEWRKEIKDLPNHHSVLGNHDILESSSVDYESDNYRYAFMLAPEESADMVMGGGNYYYIDNTCEQTRYIYLAYPNSSHEDRTAQGEFIVEALKSTPEGWHIVAIAHQWWAYGSDLSPATGGLGYWEADVLSVFDDYNARAVRSGSNYFYAQDFTEAKGRVEFCIGGHLHTDYDFHSEGGIPVIITTADANQDRVSDTSSDCGTMGTTTEAAVFGVVADYTDPSSTKITVVGVGRGESRVVRPRVNLFDKGDPDVLLTGRFNSSKDVVAYAEGQLVTGYIEAKVGDTFTVVSDKSAKANGYTGEAAIYDTNKAIITMGSQKSVSNQSGYWSWSDDNMTSTLTILPAFWDTDMSGTAWIRFCIAYTDIGSIAIYKS